MHARHITSAACQGKHVFLRADLNVPCKEGTVTDDQRLAALLPTLQLVTTHAASVVLASHLGRPPAGTVDQALSLKQLLPWFVAHGFTPIFAGSPAAAAQAQAAGARLVLLENLRFFAGEEPATTAFATTLRPLADVYVNDAFGTIHRTDASISLLPRLFAAKNRFYGLCVAHELAGLAPLKQPQKPFGVVLGGNKLETKLPLLEHLLSASEQQRPTHVLLGGLLGINLPEAIKMLASDHNVALLTPSDYRTDDAGNHIDIGPTTEAAFSRIIAGAKTIFANGTMGAYEQPDGWQGTKTVLQAIAACPGLTVLGGGDCAAAAAIFGVSKRVSFISSGGGATLAYLASLNPWLELPGLRALTADALCE